MTRHRAPEGELELGDLITAAFGLDRTWTARASCLRYTGTDGVKPTPWQVHKGQKFTSVVDGVETVVKGSEMIKVALSYCATCPAQYDCAEYAVRGKMCAGTWAMGITELKWLVDQTEVEDPAVDPFEVIEVARKLRKPLQEVAAAVRKMHVGGGGSDAEDVIA